MTKKLTFANILLWAMSKMIFLSILASGNYKELDFESNSFLENNLRLIKEVYYSSQNVKGILYFKIKILKV